MYRGTDSLIYPIRVGYSGSNAIPASDVAVFDHSSGILHLNEMKGPLKTDTCAIQEEELEDLDTAKGPNGRAWITVKFQNRCPITVPLLEHMGEEFDSVGERVVYTMEKMDLGHTNPRVFGPQSRSNNQTESPDSGGNGSKTTLYIDKPSLDDWPSAQASDEDYEEILKGMGIYNESE